MKRQVQSLASFSGLRIKHFRELWYSSQMPLRSCVAVAVAPSYSSDSTPSLGTSMCLRCSPKKKRKEKKRKERKIELEFSEFPDGTLDEGSSDVTAVALAAAVAWVQPLARELQHAVDVSAKEKENKYIYLQS